MKRISKLFKLLLLILCITIITGCSNSKNLKEITYKDLDKSLKNNETFILEIVQDGCSNCEAFTPKFKKIIEEYDIDVKQINLTNLSEEDNNNLTNLYNVSGTPTVIFITKGKEEQISKRIVGNVSKDKIISKLKTAGYIK